MQVTTFPFSRNTHHLFLTDSRPRILRRNSNMHSSSSSSSSSSNNNNNNNIPRFRGFNIVSQVISVRCNNRTQILDISQVSSISSNTCIILRLMGSRASPSTGFKAARGEPFSALIIGEGVKLMGKPHFNNMKVGSTQGMPVFPLKADSCQAQVFHTYIMSVDRSYDRGVYPVSNPDYTLLMSGIRLIFRVNSRQQK